MPQEMPIQQCSTCKSSKLQWDSVFCKSRIPKCHIGPLLVTLLNVTYTGHVNHPPNHYTDYFITLKPTGKNIPEVSEW